MKYKGILPLSSVLRITEASNDGALCVYAVNLDTDNPVAADILLWEDVWSWTTARDVFAGQDLSVNPRNEEGYLNRSITLRPGEGRLIRTDAAVKSKK